MALSGVCVWFCSILQHLFTVIIVLVVAIFFFLYFFARLQIFITHIILQENFCSHRRRRRRQLFVEPIINIQPDNDSFCYFSWLKGVPHQISVCCMFI